MLSAETYSLDSASNLSSKTVDSLTTSYTYDAINQLLTESNTGYSATYTYDSNGNRASQVLNGKTYSYSYDSGDKLNTITSGGTTVKSYAYDGAGRTHTVTTSAGTTTLSYDYEDRVTGITYPSSATNSFSYNGIDARVGKVDSTGTSTYKRDGADVTSPVLSDGLIAYTPGISERKSGSSTFDHKNFQGTFTRQTNTSQVTTATRVFDAFGNIESTTGTPQSPFGFVGGLGYQEDGDSGIKLLGHRYYDPATGRFLTRDHAKDGRNWFVYCRSMPSSGTDPSGQTGQSSYGGGGWSYTTPVVLSNTPLWAARFFSWSVQLGSNQFEKEPPYIGPASPPVLAGRPVPYPKVPDLPGSGPGSGVGGGSGSGGTTGGTGGGTGGGTAGTFNPKEMAEAMRVIDDAVRQVETTTTTTTETELDELIFEFEGG